MLLVPYFSWKISHAKHHLRTGNMSADEVFVPRHVETAVQSDHPLMHTAPMRLFMIVFMLTLGWPAYLVANVTAHPTADFVSHFWPYCSLFSQKERNLVLLSDAGLLAWGLVLYKLCCMTSLSWMICVYGVPMIVVNACLVGITALQHTHKDVPHYDASTWNWLRGALTTVDRNYGPWNIVFHHIGDTHVAHHLFHTMPHYHAQEATEAVKKVLGEYYLYDSTPIYQSLWENSLECFAVGEPKDGVLWWKRSQHAKIQ
jgi:omega-6 fatty acid desaturase (delta-12 desaturase)